ncbi:hypothetical protein GCM10009664_36530 [Kitasatospora gansuensis]
MEGGENGAGVQRAGGERPFERGRRTAVEATPDAGVGEKITSRVAVTGFTRSAGQLLHEVSERPGSRSVQYSIARTKLHDLAAAGGPAPTWAQCARDTWRTTA